MWVRRGDPRKSSSVSATRWRNSRWASGSVSSDEGERNSSRSWRMEYISEGGFESGAYIKEGRGAAWERYSGSRTWADGGRPFQTCSSMQLLSDYELRLTTYGGVFVTCARRICRALQLRS